MSKILLSNQFIRNTCKLALNEDLYPSGDITTSLIKKNVNKKAKLISNQNGIIGGLKFLIQTFKLIDNKIKIKIKKKRRIKNQKGLFNSYYRRKYQKYTNWWKSSFKFFIPYFRYSHKNKPVCKKSKKKCKICCTRKTIPNLRVIQKYAVKLGGGINHRFNLSDEYLIKDNHLRGDHSIIQIVKNAIKNKKIKKLLLK